MDVKISQILLQPYPINPSFAHIFSILHDFFPTAFSLTSLFPINRMFSQPVPEQSFYINKLVLFLSLPLQRMHFMSNSNCLPQGLQPWFCALILCLVVVKTVAFLELY